ncbi:MAG: ATP phosphoribosyltransferase regulatory subunit [Gammaproteobacteria bacterium]|nr:ATP phosphoribosyltransferase regulatory subunit [Gammaproteobacteria bacterium]
MTASPFDSQTRWLLPEGIDEFLPEQAERIETLRRDLLDLFHLWGYELVIPPLVEYIEALLVGAGTDLDLETFKLIDQVSGRLLGIRADMTPQVARIDAHRIRREAPTRLCYLDTVLHTRQDSFARSRTPLQLGVELYGHAGLESDIEILKLMVETLRLTGVQNFQLDLGHVGIFRELAREAGLSPDQEGMLFTALQRKSRPEIEEYLATTTVATKYRHMLVALVELNGGAEVLDEAKVALKQAGAPVQQALEHLHRLHYSAHFKLSPAPLHYDLAELRGYRYQSGVVFAAFAPGHGQEIARGGRYDEIGRLFGRPRPATGFSADLKTLMMLSSDSGASTASPGVVAPWSECEALQRFIRELRRSGTRVINELPGQAGQMRELGCDRRIVKQDGVWTIVAL